MAKASRRTDSTPATATNPGTDPGTGSAPTIREAKQLCTASELSLVMQSRSREAIGAADLGKAVARTRKLRDKFRDLAAQQRRAGRGKGGAKGSAGTPKADGNERTKRKAELFADALARFEAKLAAANKTVGGAKKATRERKATTQAKAAASVSAPASSRQRVRRALKADVSAKKASKQSAGGGASAKSTTKSASKSAAKATGKASAKSSAESSAKATGTSSPKASGKASARASAEPKPSPSFSTPTIATPESAFAAAGFDATLRGTVGRQAKVARRGKRVTAKFLEANAPKIRGHVSARGRRNQAKRDARGR